MPDLPRYPRRPILARFTKRELTLLKFLAHGAWIHVPRGASTLHPMTDAEGRPLLRVQRAVVQRLVDARRIVWREDLQAYVITETGLELLHRVTRAA